MTELTIKFFVRGFVKQRLLIGTEETPAQILSKIKRGIYLVTIAEREITKRKSSETIGVVLDQNHAYKLKISGFELIDDPAAPSRRKRPKTRSATRYKKA